MQRVLVVVVAGVLFAGCDFVEWPSERKAKEAAIRQEAVRQEEKAAEETKGECAALKHHVGMQLGIVHSARAEAEKVLSDLLEDRKVLSARLVELSEKNMADKAGTRATALYAILKDEEINKIALKHLGNDFAVLRNEFGEKMRVALNQERNRKAAFDHNRASFDRAVEESAMRAEKSRQAIASGLAQVKRDIAETESHLRHLRRDSMVASTQAKENRKRAIAEAENRLRVLKDRQTDLLTRNSETKLAHESDTHAAADRKRALEERERADKAIREQAKSDMSPMQLAEEYESRTIRHLDTVLLEKNRTAQDQLKLADEKVAYLTSATNGLDQLNAPGLRRVRADIDAWLAKKTPGIKNEKRR